MKAFLISDHAKWCALMMNGDKSVEVRKGTALYKATKKLIDEYGYAEFYVYCTKSNTEFLVGSKDKVCEIITKKANDRFSPNIDRYIGNGKVLFKFRCYKVEEIVYQRVFEENPFHFLEEESGYGTDTLNANEFKKETCLTDKELENYLNTNKPNKRACAIHISDLEIFDKPKELNGFKSLNENENKCRKCPYYVVEDNESYSDRFCMFDCCRITKAPQSFMFIESEK